MLNSFGQNFRNVTALLIAQAVAAGVGIFAFIRIGVIFDVTELGRFGFAASSTVLFGLLAELGVRYIAIKEVALNATRSSQVFRHSVLIRIGLSSLSLALLMLCAAIYPPWQKDIGLLLLAGMGAVSQFGAEPAAWVFFGLGRVDIGAIILIIDRILYVVLLNVFALVFHTAEWLMLAAFAANLLRALIAWLWVRPTLRQQSVSQPIWDYQLIKQLIREGMAIGFAVVISVSYTEISTVVAQTVTTSEELGYFAVALGVIQICLIVPMSLTNALFPALAATQNGEKLRELYRMMLRLTLIMTLPLGVITFTFAEPLLATWAGGRYVQAALILRILAIGMIASSFNYLYRIFLFAQNHPGIESLIDLFGLAAFVVIGGGFGSVYGSLGLAAVFTSLEIVLLVVKFIATWRWLGLPPDLAANGRAVAAVILPAVVVTLPFSTSIRLLLYSVFSIALIVAFGVIPVSYWKLALSQIRRIGAVASK